MTGVALIKMSFFTVGSKQKIKMEIRNTSIQNARLFKRRESYFSFVWVKEVGIISSCLDKVKAFFQFNLTILVGVERLHENDM